MDIRRGRQAPARLPAGDPYRFQFLYDFADPSNLESLGPRGRPLNFNKSWKIEPVAGFGRALRCVTTQTTATRLDTGVSPSQLNWSSANNPRSALLVFYMGTEYGGSQTGNPPILGAGADSSTGFFQLNRQNYSTNGLAVSYYGGPDLNCGAQAAPGTLVTLAYSFDGTTHRAVVVARNPGGSIKSTTLDTSTVVSNTATGAANFVIGANAGPFPNAFWPGGVSDALFLVGGASVAWSEAQLRRLALDPYQVLDAAPALRFAAPAAGGGSTTTLAPGKGALAFGGKTPTVQQLVTTTVAPGKRALTLTGYQPTIGAFSVTTLAPTKGALAFGGKTPTVQQFTVTGLAPAKGALAFSGKQPAVQQFITTGLTPAKGALVFNGKTPTIGQTVTTSLTPTKVRLALAGYQPTVTNSGVLKKPAGQLPGVRRRHRR